MKIALLALIGVSISTVVAAQIRHDDYPPFALRNNHEGRVSYHLGYGPNGRATSCSVTASSGYAELDEATCRLMTARARFKLGSSGERDGFIDWRIPIDRPKADGQ
jgi:TonB family protein